MEETKEKQHNHEPDHACHADHHHHGGGKWWETTLLIAVLSLILLGLFSSGGSSGWLGRFSKSFLSFLLEAAPFILIGAVISGLLEVFLPSELLPKITKRLGVLGIPATALLSAAFPICECGVVMVARGLMRKGLPLSHAIAYLLAAPILNPTVLASTYVAFYTGGSPWSFVIARAAGGFTIAVTAGFLFKLASPEKAFLSKFSDELSLGKMAHSKQSQKISRVLLHARADFVTMMPFLMFGVALASSMQTFVPRQTLVSIGQGPVVGSAVMMVMAFVLSLCSEADAFIAYSFSRQFVFAAVMSFLVLGPMLDIKLILMYRTVFKRKFIALFSFTIIGLAIIYTAVLALIGGGG